MQAVQLIQTQEFANDMTHSHYLCNKDVYDEINAFDFYQAMWILAQKNLLTLHKYKFTPVTSMGMFYY
jgi:hypothetical protein